jgi:hypothetical protein
VINFDEIFEREKNQKISFSKKSKIVTLHCISVLPI